MDTQVLELVKISISVLTPALVLTFGLLINRTLEKGKTVLAKEKEWQSWWAAKFLGVAYEYTSTISECVTTLFAIGQISAEKLPNWETELKEKEDTARSCVRKIQHLEWEIQNYTQFAPKSGPAVTTAQRLLFGLIRDMMSSRHGNLEEIRKAQFQFNTCTRTAHAEMLGMPT